MASRTHVGDYDRPIVRERGVVRAEPARQTYNLLHVAYTLVPLLAGVDKFLHKLVDWDKYLSPFVTRLVKGHGHEFMLAVGVVEIVAALGVMLKPRIFGYVVAFWLWGIVANLILAHGFYDIALRDFGLSLGALALARIARDFDGRGVDRRHDRDVVVDRS